MSSSTFHTVRDFIAHVGRDKFQRNLGYSTQLVTRALSQGYMPARWYLRVRDLCDGLGVEAPEHLFRMDRASLNKQFANDTTAKQVGKSRKNNNRGCNS